MTQASLQEAMMRRAIEASPMGRALRSAVSRVPRVRPPSLAGLGCTVKTGEVTVDDVEAELGELLVRCATRRAKATGERVAKGDEVVCDVIGFVDGVVLPFSVRRGLRHVLGRQEPVPGFADGLIGKSVGEAHVIQTRVTDDYPLAELRGKQATLAVKIEAAFALTVPALESAEFLTRANLGTSIEEVLTQIAQDKTRERSLLAYTTARDTVLDQLAARTRVEISDELISDEISQMWMRLEGRLLLEMGLPPADRDAAVQRWVRSPQLRADARRRLAVTATVCAVAKRDAVVFTVVQLRMAAAAFAREVGVPEGTIDRELANIRAHKELVDVFAYERAVEHILSKCEIRFIA